MIYRHYKGGQVRWLCNAREATSTRAGKGTGYDAVVVYVDLASGDICVRDAEEFHGNVSMGDKACKRFVEVPS